MESDRAQLSALQSTLDDVTERITEIAGRYQSSPRIEVSQGLYEVERSLNTASRHLAKVMRTMRA